MNSEAEEDCGPSPNADNNNHCNSYLFKTKHECNLTYSKSEDAHTAVLDRQETQTSKPVLKFSVNAILGSDHGKSSFKSGESKLL